MLLPKKILTIILIVALLGIFAAPRPTNAVGLYFGGKILASYPRVCLFPLGIIPIPVPMQVIYVGAPSYNNFVYIWYSVILQAFGVYTSFYLYGQFYHAGPSVLGQYLPGPIPWINCPDLSPTNIITKLGTSLF